MNNYIKKIVAENFGLLFHDFFKRTNIRSTYRFLLKSQYWDDNKMIQYNLDKLKSLYSFVIKNNEFYKKKYSGLIDENFSINNIDDIKKLPILTKEDIRNDDILSKNINLKKLSISKTGGTTGPPTTIYKNTETKSFAWGSWYRWYNWMGINHGDPSVTLWGSSLVLSKSIKNNIYRKITNSLENNYTINSFNINDKTIEVIIKKLCKIKPVIIKGYLSAIIQLADYLNKQKIKYKPICISTTTETLLPPFREYLEKTFDCRIYDQYASTEITGVAFECSKHKGLHITSEHIIVEVLDENNEPVYDKKGRIVTTDLDNKAMPFIRYKIGDIGILSTEKCECGVNLPLLKSIEGRATDTIVLKDGSKVHGVFFTDILHELKSKNQGKRISRFQAVQEKTGYLEFRLETNMHNLENEYINELKEALLRFFYDVELKVLPVLHNDKSGKFRYVISNIK